MAVSDFLMDAVRKGGKMTGFLKITKLPNGSTLRLPVLAAKGRNDGRVLTVLAGVHGNEFAGIQAIRDVFSKLDPESMQGAFIGAPILNPPAVQAVRRNSPIDGLNLARSFPGDAKGTVSQRIACLVAERIIASSDFVIDLHTAGVSNTMPFFCGYSHDLYPHDSVIRAESREGALAFGAVGADVIVGHSWKSGVTKVNRGTSLEEASNRGIPSIYTESSGAGCLNPDAVSFYARGVLNVMKHLSILPDKPDIAKPKLFLVGPGYQVLAPQSGFLLPKVDLLDKVRAGDVLGVLVGLFGETVAQLVSEYDGWITAKRCTPIVFSGVECFRMVLDE